MAAKALANKMEDDYDYAMKVLMNNDKIVLFLLNIFMIL